jgi:hypothetical protein
MQTEKSTNTRIGTWRFVRWLIIASFVILLGILVGGFRYYRNLTSSPQYSLALLVDAARRGDVNMIQSLVDSDAVVDSFIPQVTDAAIELFGRGLPPQIASKILKLIAPAMPAIKNRAREELPGVIQEKTSEYEGIPFWLLVIGADRGLNIKVEGDYAKISPKVSEQPFEFEMQRNGNLWRIVAIKDKEIAKKIAEQIGQQILAAVNDGKLDEIGSQFGVKNLDEILDKAQEIFR